MALNRVNRFVFILLFSVSGSNCTSAGKKIKNHQIPIQGYVVLSNQLFEKTDSNYFPMNLAGGDTALLINSQRRMFIYGHFLIDAIPTKHVDVTGGLKIDTTEVTFYDLKKQLFVTFKRLEIGSEIIRKGKMKENGSFSDDPQFDPFNSVSDEEWIQQDTVINGKRVTLVGFKKLPDDLEKYASRVKFWVDKKCDSFPIQLSYILSKKMDKGFVYKMQLPASEGPAVMVTSFEYQHAILPDSIIALFNTWSEKIN